jgi:hypothetical protein
VLGGHHKERAKRKDKTQCNLTQLEWPKKYDCKFCNKKGFSKQSLGGHVHRRHPEKSEKYQKGARTRKKNENLRIIKAITKFVHLKNKKIADLKGEKAKETIKEFMKNRKAVIDTRNNITYENIEEYYESIYVKPGNAKITQIYQEIHTPEPAVICTHCGFEFLPNDYHYHCKQASEIQKMKEDLKETPIIPIFIENDSTAIYTPYFSMKVNFWRCPHCNGMFDEATLAGHFNVLKECMKLGQKQPEDNDGDENKKEEIKNDRNKNSGKLVSIRAEEKIRELMPRNEKKNRSEKLVKAKKCKLKHRQETSKKRVKRINESE